MNPIFSKFYHHTRVGNIMRYAFHKIKNELPDVMIVKHRYKKKMGKPLNLRRPRTLNEKINWLKLNDRTSLHTQCADKYEVRKYIIEKIGKSYLVPLYFQTKNSRSKFSQKI